MPIIQRFRLDMMRNENNGDPELDRQPFRVIYRISARNSFRMIFIDLPTKMPFLSEVYLKRNISIRR